MEAPTSILVRMPNWIGDLVMATPVLTDLRAAFPDAAITAMCSKPLCELLKQDQRINELFCFTRPPNKFLRREGKRDIIGKLVAGHYDVGILLTNSFSSAWWFWQASIPRRIGYSKHFRRWLLTDPVAMPQEKTHQVYLYKQLLVPLGIDPSLTSPRLYLTDQEAQEMKKRLLQRGYVPGKTLIGINPGAAYGAAKCWPWQKFRGLIQRLLKEKELYFVIVGDAKTVGLSRKIGTGLDGRVIDFTGSTSLRELTCLIQECDLFVTNDSGPMHLADALNVPLVALFGSTDDQVTGPYMQKEAIMNKRVSCSPCMKRECPIDFRCMEQISVEEVAAFVLNRLSRV